MSEKIEFEVTQLMREAVLFAYNGSMGQPSDWADAAIKAAIAHPSFQSQLRAYVAEQMRGLVPAEYFPESGSTYHYTAASHKNTCRAETLANIAAYEKGEPQ